MKFNTIDAAEFLDVVRPALEACDPARLAHAVRIRWRPSLLCSLLRHEDTDARRVAAVTLGLVGDMSCTPSLTRALRDADEQVNQMAEHGLWSIWFRSGRPEANGPFREGVVLLSAEAYERAIDQFEAASAIDPQFAEAHNQCAIAHYLLGQWDSSIAQCARAVRLVPAHFGAIAGMGHGHTQKGELGRALTCYRRALRINPRMPAIARAIERLERGAEVLDSCGQSLVDQSRN